MGGTCGAKGPLVPLITHRPLAHWESSVHKVLVLVIFPGPAQNDPGATPPGKQSTVVELSDNSRSF